MRKKKMQHQKNNSSKRSAARWTRAAGLGWPLLLLLLLLLCGQPASGKHYNFTLAFLTAVSNKGEGKFVGGAFFLALDHLNNISSQLLENTGSSATFQYVFRDTYNVDTKATRAMVDLYCSDINITAFIGPNKFCNSGALLASSFGLPFLSYDCNDIHTLRSSIGKYLMVNMQPSVAYVAKSIVAVLLKFQWRSMTLISGTGNSTNDWTDIGQYLRGLARSNGIVFNDVVRESLNDEYHSKRRNEKPFLQIISETRDKTRVYVFLGNYNSLLDFLRDLNDEGVTSKGEHVVIAVADKPSFNSSEDYFLLVEEVSGKKVNLSHLLPFRNVLLLKRQEPATAVGEDFKQLVYQRNYQPPINLPEIPAWWPHGSMHQHLRQESFYLYDAVIHYGDAVFDLILRQKDPYNASLIIDLIRNSTLKSIQGFDVHINEDGESEGRYVVLSLAYDKNGPIDNLTQVGTFNIEDGNPVYMPTNNSITWVTGRVPVSDPPCGFDGSKCREREQSEWKLVAIGIGLAVMVLIGVGATFMGLRYWLIVRRMRRQALAAARAACVNSFVELQEQDREGLLVC